MSALLRSAFVVALLLVLLYPTVLGQGTQAPAIDSGLAAADKLYRDGKFVDAEASYNALLKIDSKLEPAQVGLIRAMLGQQKIDDALDTVNAALAAEPTSVALLAAKGDVQFRRGEMQEAEKSYLAAHKLPHAQLGLARLYLSYSMYRRAYDLLQIAHQTAPDDVEVQGWWLTMLPRRERLAVMETFLASSHPGHEDEISSMTKHFEALKTRVSEPTHPCKLVSKVDQTEMKMMHADRVDDYYGRRYRTYVRAMGLSTKINDHSLLLQLDTGASGIIVSPNSAKAMGLTVLSTAYIGGIGDQGPQRGYREVADHIQIGDLEFQDCVVIVALGMPSGVDGIIGPDVFARYLIDINVPEMRLKLAPLPKRPEDSVAPTSLDSDIDEQSTGGGGR